MSDSYQRVQKWVPLDVAQFFDELQEELSRQGAEKPGWGHCVRLSFQGEGRWPADPEDDAERERAQRAREYVERKMAAHEQRRVQRRAARTPSEGANAPDAITEDSPPVPRKRQPRGNDAAG